LTLLVSDTERILEQLLPLNDGTGFLGLIATASFSTVTLFAVDNNETFGMDNVSFAVPEPATFYWDWVSLVYEGAGDLIATGSYAIKVVAFFS
jgi:hypothetical protein